MTDRETIRAFVAEVHDAEGPAVLDPRVVPAPQSHASGWADGRADLCHDILAHIDSLPPPAENDALVEVARWVKHCWAVYYDCQAKPAYGVTYQFAAGVCQQCDTTLMQIQSRSTTAAYPNSKREVTRMPEIGPVAYSRKEIETMVKRAVVATEGKVAAPDGPMVFIGLDSNRIALRQPFHMDRNRIAQLIGTYETGDFAKDKQVEIVTMNAKGVKVKFVEKGEEEAPDGD